ncbi:MAG: SpaH/EbpB family LPXTG-anchored major pilin [Atopobiaceae bacterium]|nr:SpaH/EbpB family LPXTG-anchored major pilin [Atopobiaceae bacterium]
MKHLKKFIAAALTMFVALAMAVPAFAGTITVTGVRKGETYKAYKILEYTSDTSVTPAAYSYYLNKDEKGTALKGILEGAGFSFTESADGSQYVLDETEMDADTIVANLKTAGLTSTNVLAYAEATAESDEQAVFTNLDAGYWFVSSTMGSLCALASYDDEELIVEKNTMITDAKVVDTASESLQVGDTATYTITLTDGKGTNLAATLTDTMSAGLTYNDDATVTANGETLVKDTDYTVSFTGGNGAETVVVYTFTPEVMTKLNENEKIVVTYTATLNQYASLDGTETNTEVTKYSEQNTPGNTVTVHDYNLTIQKKAGSEDGNSLKGAQFALYRDDATTALNVMAITVENSAANTVYYRVAAEGETGATTVIDMTNAYDAVIYGLDGDSTYSIEETKAPDGYNKLEGKIAVAMGDANKVQPVVNNAGSVLPSTGGMGTTILYIIGGILVVGGGIYLLTKKRMGKE